MIHLGETLPVKLEGDRREIRWGTLLLLIGVLFSCSLVSFGIGAPTGEVLATSRGKAVSWEGIGSAIKPKCCFYAVRRSSRACGEYA